MSAIVCPSQERLFAFALGELPEPDLTDVAEHLNCCLRCGEQAGELDRAADTILVGLKLIGNPGLRTLIAAQETVGWVETEDVPLLAETWGDFRIVREIGRGGMGIVYEAFQESLNRHVAVKLLREPADLARFRREAKAAGRLHHTNIVPVHGIGDHAGWHYYVMQYIVGRGLDQALRGPRAAEKSGAGPAVDYRNVARIALQAAEALAYAHDQGVVHRDIKPSNILLDERGTVWITDFGLAYDSDDTQTLTHTGDVLGTIRYMAPERFAGRTDAGADIYGLGATLFELATGQAAFAQADRAVLIHRVLHEDPPPPRQLDPRVPRDLETIVLKAMAREPSHRYATAVELAGDLRRFVEDRPIRARRVGAWERGVRWCRRNPLAAGLLAGLVLVFLGGFAGVTVQWRRAEAAGTRAANEASRANAEAARASALAIAEAEARSAEKTLRVQAQAEIVARDFDRGVELARRGDGDLGMLWLGEALRQAPPEEPALPRLIRANVAAWLEPSPSLRAILEHRGIVSNAVFRPDGRAVLTGSLDFTARLWDTATGRPIGPPLAHGDKIFSVAFSPDGRQALTGGFDHKVRVWDPATGRPAGPTLDHGERVWAVAYAHGGRRIITMGADYKTRLWEAATGQPVGPPLPMGALSPDGRLVASVGQDGLAQLWDVVTGRPSGPSLPHGPINRTAFSPDSRIVATGGADGTVWLWVTATRQRIAALPRQVAAVTGIDFSPDGRRVLRWGANSTALVSEWATGPSIGRPTRPVTVVGNRVIFSPDGRLIATAGADLATRLWDAATGRPVGLSMRHGLAGGPQAFSPDGRLLLTTSEDATAKLWEIDHAGAGAAAGRAEGPTGETAATTPAPGPGLGFKDARFSSDRSRVILMGQSGLARLVDMGSGQPVGPPMEQRWPRVRSAAFSPDGTRLAIASHDAGYGSGGSTSTACRIWDAAAGRPLSPLLPHINWVAALAFRPDGEVLATGDYSGAVLLWDVCTGARVGGPFYAFSIVLSLAFSPDGRVLAAGTADPAFQVVAWNLATSRPLAEPVHFRGEVRHLAFSGDGTRLAAGSQDGTVRLIEVATGRVIGEPLRNDGWAYGLAFGPDGRSLLTVSGGKGETGAARLWDARSGQPTSPGMAHPTRIAEDALAFSPDGSAFATGCVDGSVRIWDVATARPIGPPRMLRGPALGVEFGRDGRSLLAVDDHGNVRTWTLREPPAGPLERLIGRVQARTGVELDATKEVAVIDPAEWRRRRGKSGEPWPPPGPAAEAGWHEACARDGEAIGDGFGARWHLDRLIAARPDDGLLYARRARAWLWAEDVRAADVDLTRAIDLGPRDRVLDWLEHRAADALEDGRPADAIRLLDRVVAARPDDWRAYSLRADVHARLGRPVDREADLARAIELEADIPFLTRLAAERCRAARWLEAVALYDRAIAMGTVPYEVWTEAAIAHLEVGDEAGYRRVCEVMRGRYPADVPEILVRASLASVLTLMPGVVGDDGKGLAWTESLPAADVPAGKEHWRRSFFQVLGAVLFRTGQSAEAIERTREGIAMDGGEPSFDEAVFLAMAYSTVGDHASALALMSRLGDGGPEGPSSDAWWTARARRLLRREAVRLILDREFPADPFAR